MNGSRTDAIVTSAFLWSALPTPEQSAMTDNTEDRGPQDRSRISLGQDYEVRYWSQRFGINEEQLRAAVEDVGPSVQEVEQYLANREGLH